MFQGYVGKIFQNTIFGEHSKTSRGAHLRGEHVQLEDILLMEEIPNNHLGCIKPVNNGINYLLYQLVQDFSHPQYFTKI